MKRASLPLQRREFIALISGAAVVVPFAVPAQQMAMPVIGYVGTGSRESDAFRLPSFHQGLSESGYVEGRNVAIEYRWAEGQNDRLPTLMADLVRRRVAVIAVPASTPGALAAKAATSTIPIVFYIGLDPVELGLVASLNRPSGNLTGVTGWNVAVGPKRLELLHQLIPTATVMALLVQAVRYQMVFERTVHLDADDAAKRPPDFLMDELPERLKQGPVTFHLKAQLAAGRGLLVQGAVFILEPRHRLPRRARQ